MNTLISKYKEKKDLYNFITFYFLQNHKKYVPYYMFVQYYLKEFQH